jgi:hypothetical protein
MADEQISPIERLRAELPSLMTVREYMQAKNCCEATAYNDLKRVPGLGVKLCGPAGPTRIVRDVWLDHLANSPWVPEKDRERGEVRKPDIGARPHRRPRKQPELATAAEAPAGA